MLQATDLLAGPILRRVEPNLISVWVALTTPAKVEIEVFRGQGPGGTLGPAVPRKAPASPLDVHTIAAGAKLHVVVSMWEPAALAGLELGQVFSYDLLITADDGSTARLKDLGLLQDHPDTPKWLALGYNQDWLPSFAMVPEKVTDLKVAQGSCRASAGQGRDGLPPLDDFIRAGLTDPKKRLHMLFLTGDQIYADEVEAQQLEMLQAIANELIGGDKASAAETIAVEFKATGTEPAATVHYPVDTAHIPPGRRGHLLNDLAGFTSTSTDSHVMGFGEYCALYLTGWSTVNWGDWKPRELLAARKDPFERYVLEAGRGHKKLKTFIELHPDKDGDVLEAMVKYHDAWRLVPKKFRAIDATLSAQDRKAAWGHGEKGADGTNFFAWEEAWGPDPDNPPVPETDETAADMPASPRTNAELNRLARALTPSWLAGAHYFGVNYEVTEELVNPGVLKLKTKSDGVYNRVHRLEWFFRDVPRVRRLLANVPTYMVFDDHEITDDWNISPKWARQTRGNALGRAVIRNGLAACTLCQNWGNDPKAFRPGTMGRRVLDQIVAMFAGATPTSPGPKTAPAEALEGLFDLKPPTPTAERMTWHFRYEGPGFEVISLDSRTCRGFEPEGNESTRARFSEEATATLLTDEAMRLQVPEQPPVGVNPDGVCLVIAAAPFIGYPVVESIVQPLMNLRDIAQAEKPEPPFLRWKRLEAAAQLTLELFRILKVHVSGIGAAYRAGMATEGEGNIAGVAKMGWTPVLPEGAGIELKVWKIEGGGALFYDAAKERLSGALELHFAKKFSLTGLGIYQRAIAGGPRSWLVVVSMELPQSGPGFQFAGLGLLYGSNRSTNPEAFLAGLITGDLDAVLFPDDPIGHAPQYLAALERLFPAKENSTVLGISAKFTALGGRLRLDLGVIIEGSDLARMYIVAQFVGLLKKPKPGEQLDPLSQPVRVLADGVAIWDSQTDELNLRIMLRNSRVWAGELTGGASLFHGSPQTDGQERGTYISVGGFHPDYVPPGTKIFVPPRLSLVLSKGDHLKLEMRAYVAFTPSSLQFGATGSLEARLYGFGIRGRLSLDVLIGFDGTFNLKIEFSVELLLGSKSIAAVRFVGTIEGFTPSVLSGKVEVKFLFWTLSKHGSKTLYEGDSPEESVNVQESLAAAVADAANWNSGGAPGLALTDRDRDGVWLSPTEPLRFRQPVVPLNVPIERFGAVKLPGAITLRIERVSSGPGELRTNPIAGEFALGMFLNLTQEEMLASRGFETRDAGVELERALENGEAVTASAGFEEILLDPLKRPEEPAPMTVVLGNLSVFELDTARTVAPVKIRRERFAVVDEGLQLQGGARGFFEARAALRPGLRVVPEAEVVV